MDSLLKPLVWVLSVFVAADSRAQSHRPGTSNLKYAASFSEAPAAEWCGTETAKQIVHILFTTADCTVADGCPSWMPSA